MRTSSVRSRLLASLLACGLGLGSLAACSGDDDDDSGGGAAGGTQAAEPLPIGEVRTFEVTSNHHVSQTVDYPQTPPVGGDHAGAWQTCGFYDAPIYSEAAVHSMEHGAVWITYRPNLPEDQVALIRSYADQPYTLASPWDGDPGAPIVLSAWGAQLALDSLPNPQADEFLTGFREALSAPEPGAPCTGGTTATK